MINSDPAFHLFSRHSLRDYWVPNTILRIKTWIIYVVWPWEAYSRVEMKPNWCIIYISSPSFYGAHPEGCGGFSGTKAYACLELVGVSPSDDTSEGLDDQSHQQGPVPWEWIICSVPPFLRNFLGTEYFIGEFCSPPMPTKIIV